MHKHDPERRQHSHDVYQRQIFVRRVRVEDSLPAVRQREAQQQPAEDVLLLALCAETRERVVLLSGARRHVIELARVAALLSVLAASFAAAQCLFRTIYVQRNRGSFTLHQALHRHVVRARVFDAQRLRLSLRLILLF